MKIEKIFDSFVTVIISVIMIVDFAVFIQSLIFMGKKISSSLSNLSRENYSLLKKDFINNNNICLMLYQIEKLLISFSHSIKK